MKMDIKSSVALLGAPGKHTLRTAAFVLRCSGAATFAWQLSAVFELSQPVWAAMSALIISQARLHDTRSCLLGRIFGTLLGIAISLSVNVLGCRMHAPIVLQMALAVGICSAVTFDLPAFRVAMWTCPIILLTASCATPVALAALARGSEVILGAIVGLVFHWSAEVLVDAVRTVLNSRSSR